MRPEIRRLAMALMAPALVACGQDKTTEPLPAAGEVLTVVFPSHPADTMRVLVSARATIDAAQRYLSTGQGPRMLVGRIVKGAASDPRYPFHFLPESVTLADNAMEICDGAPMHTAEEVSQYFTWSTGSASSESAPYCPWESRPIAITMLAMD